jgi:DNA-binding transcriptional MerR regulator
VEPAVEEVLAVQPSGVMPRSHGARGEAGAAEADDEQDLLFSDDVSPLPSNTGYRGPTACNAAGITYRQLDYWARTGLVEPSVRGVAGSGSQRLYSFRDILILKVVKRLLDAGISLQQIRTVVDQLRERGTDDLTRVTLMSDGESVYECTSSDEVIDLLQRGQGVFGIAVGGVWREIESTLSELPSEVVSAPAPSPHAEEVDRQALDAWKQFRNALVHSLDRVDQLPVREQVEVVNLFSELHMSEQLKELEGVVDLDVARRRRGQAATQRPTEDVQVSEG